MREAKFEEIRKVQYDILKETAAYCDAHGIQYFMTGGTLLGAVRHQGYIPWDDDIDIAMPRPDYNRLLELSGGTLGNHYEISVFENNENHARLFMRIVDNRTVYEHKYYSKKYRSALGIDVFPMDGVPQDVEECKKYFRNIRRLKKQFALSQSAWFRSTNPIRAVVKTLTSIPARIRGRDRIYQRVMDVVNQYSFLESECVGITVGVYLEKEVLKKQELYPIVDLPFEDGIFHAPACYDKYLRQLYGDYMQLPKEADRKRGHAFQVYWK